MRTLVASLLFIAACSVSEKQPVAGDGGIDAPVDPLAPPETEITSAPPEFSNDGTAMFEFTSNNPEARFTCSVDGEPAIACTSPFSRGLPDGTHTFSVRAINANGDGDATPAEHLWSIDTVAPITTLTETPPAADNSTMVRFSFMSNEMFVTFECSLDGAQFAMCRSGDEVGPIGDGAHSFSVRARDRAGNVDASPAVHAWQVDTSTPDTTIVSGPSGQVASSSATFTFLSPDAGPGAVFECSLDGSAFAVCTSPISYEGLAMGVHTFSVRVRDASGNYDPTPATRTWTADITPPETTITSAPSGTVGMASALIAFTSNEANSTYACSLDGAPYAACSSPFSATNLAQGSHTFAVFATDPAGNADATPATAAWIVDTVAPEIAFTAGPAAGAVSGPFVAFAFTVNEGTSECRLNGGAWTACPSPFSYNQAAGAATFEVRSIDEAGNETIAVRSFSIACSAPSAAGASGLLSFEDGTQVLANGTGGASATLGPTAEPETADPAFVSGRFGMGIELTAIEMDSVSWPISLGVLSTFSLEVWAQPAALSGTRDIAVTGDNRFALRVTLDGTNTVRFVGAVLDGSGVMHMVTSAPVAAGAFHLVALSMTMSALTIVVDGTVTSVALPPSDLAFDHLQLGGTYGGTLDEVWLANAAYDQPLARYCPVSGVRLAN